MNAPAWTLDDPYPGGATGSAWRGALDAVSARLEVLSTHIASLGSAARFHQEWRAVLREAFDLMASAAELSSIASCHWATAARDIEARRASDLAEELRRAVDAARLPLRAQLDALDDPAFHKLVDHPDLVDLLPRLTTDRRGARLRLDPALQQLVIEMEREALHGWGSLYTALAGEAHGDLDGRPTTVAELASLVGHPEASVRHAAHDGVTQAWRTQATACATALTHIVGTRQQRQDRLGVDELADTLHRNRAEPATLDAMWEACEAARPALQRYLAHKAALLGKDRLDWWDLSAPVGSVARLEWEPAFSGIVKAFEGFDPALARFAESALARGWIDGTARPGKRPGAFCSGWHASRQSRVFLTWGESQRSAITLAHELGHAWHNEVLFGLPYARRNLTSALAETASTFGETLYRDHALAHAHDDDERLATLDQQCQAGVAFLMNIPARFAFERRLYALRRDGPFDPDQLSEEMERCQREAYDDLLASWDPMLWASKLHFYISDFAFYNWPYTFGYLFSSAVYRRAQQQGPGFSRTWKSLLEQTGYAWSEPLAADVLGVDLADPAFWRDATAPLRQAVDAFCALAAARQDPAPNVRFRPIGR